MRFEVLLSSLALTPHTTCGAPVVDLGVWWKRSAGEGQEGEPATTG